MKDRIHDLQRISRTLEQLQQEKDEIYKKLEKYVDVEGVESKIRTLGLTPAKENIARIVVQFAVSIKYPYTKLVLTFEPVVVESDKYARLAPLAIIDDAAKELPKSLVDKGRRILEGILSCEKELEKLEKDLELQF